NYAWMALLFLMVALLGVVTLWGYLRDSYEWKGLALDVTRYSNSTHVWVNPRGTVNTHSSGAKQSGSPGNNGVPPPLLYHPTYRPGAFAPGDIVQRLAFAPKRQDAHIGYAYFNIKEKARAMR